MKRILAVLMIIATMAVMIPSLAGTASAQTGGYTPYYGYGRPSFYRRHRNLSNIGIATGAGALLGAAIGGGRGAAVGAMIGASGGALYTYRIRPKRGYYYYR